MAGFVQGVDRAQATLFPARLDEYVAEDNLVRAVDAFVDGLDLDGLGFIHVSLEPVSHLDEIVASAEIGERFERPFLHETFEVTATAF